MGAVGSVAVAAAVWLTAVGLAGPAGVQAATQTEIVAIEEADVHESLNRFLEEKEANAVALVEDWERKSPASEASLSEAGDASEESVAAYINRSYRVPLEEARQLTAWAKHGSGAEGLMQVMTSVHTEKFKAFGGAKAAMEPYPNMVVGASILARLIDRTGSVSQGLKHYYGAGNQSSDNGYAAKVFKERSRLQVAAAGDSDRAVELSRANRTGPAYNAKHRPRNLGYGEWMQLLETRAQQGGSVKRLAPESDAVAENRRSSDSAEGSSTES